VHATSLIEGLPCGEAATVRNPAALTQIVGSAANATAADADRAVAAARAAFDAWDARAASTRAPPSSSASRMPGKSAHDELAA